MIHQVSTQKRGIVPLVPAIWVAFPDLWSNAKHCKTTGILQLKILDMFSSNGLDGLPATSATGQVPGYKPELRSTSMCANLVVESDHIVRVGNLCFESDLRHKWSHVSSSLLPILSIIIPYSENLKIYHELILQIFLGFPVRISRWDTPQGTRISSFGMTSVLNILS